jgi:undecaprenyl pyrophosphate synthase
MTELIKELMPQHVAIIMDGNGRWAKAKGVPRVAGHRAGMEAMKKIVALIRQYDCARHCYFMLEPDLHIRQFKEYAPDIPVCVGHLSARPWEIVDRAIELGAEKVQLFKPYYNKEMIDKAHAHGIKCNVFWSDNPEEANELLDLGVDTILSNQYQIVYDAIKDRLHK